MARRMEQVVLGDDGDDEDDGDNDDSDDDDASDDDDDEDDHSVEDDDLAGARKMKQAVTGSMKQAVARRMK